ncbi:hypothetical protein Tco_0482049 [Tanacetum coccineum]
MVTYLKKIEGSEGFYQIVDFLNTSHIWYALIENPTIYVSLIQQFWQTATTSTLDNGEMEITATIDGKVKIVTEASIRRHLKLEDSDGISNLPTTKIFEQLALMGSKKTSWEQFSSNIATAIICLATNRKFNFSKLIFDGMGPIFQREGSTVPVESHHTPTGAPSTSQPHFSPTLRSSIRQETKVPQPNSPLHTNVADEVASTGVDVRYRGAATIVTSLEVRQGSGKIDKTPTMPHDSPLSRVHTLGSDEGRIQHNKLMDLVTNLSNRVVALETDLTQTKKVYGAAFTKLINKGRKIAQIDEDEGITLKFIPNCQTAPEVKTAGDSVNDIAAESLGQQEQERLGLETAMRLQEEFDEEERQRIARVHKAARSYFPAYNRKHYSKS